VNPCYINSLLPNESDYLSILVCHFIPYRDALKRAKMLLSMKHGLARLDNVWGVGGGQRPVMYLVNKVNASHATFATGFICLLGPNR